MLLGHLVEFANATNQRIILIVFDEMTIDNFFGPEIIDDFGKGIDA